MPRADPFVLQLLFSVPKFILHIR